MAKASTIRTTAFRVTPYLWVQRADAASWVATRALPKAKATLRQNSTGFPSKARWYLQNFWGSVMLVRTSTRGTATFRVVWEGTASLGQLSVVALTMFPGRTCNLLQTTHLETVIQFLSSIHTQICL